MTTENILRSLAAGVLLVGGTALLSGEVPKTQAQNNRVLVPLVPRVYIKDGVSCWFNQKGEQVCLGEPIRITETPTLVPPIYTPNPNQLTPTTTPTHIEIGPRPLCERLPNLCTPTPSSTPIPSPCPPGISRVEGGGCFYDQTFIPNPR